jgi:hypothetical protein
MLCPNCGQVVEEGKPFCKFCGTATPQGSDAGASGASDIGSTAIKARTAPAIPPPPSFVPTTPVPPPGFTPASLPPPAAGYGAGWQPPQGPLPGRSHAGMIVGSVAAAIIVLGGLGVGLWLGLRGDDGGDGNTVTTRVASSTTKATGTGATGAGTTTTVNGSSTTQTIPSLTTTSGGATTTTAAGATTTSGGATTTTGPAVTTTTVDVLEEWYLAHDDLVAELDYEDSRVHELAINNINTTMPDVPDWVVDELSEMLDTLDPLGAALDATAVPPGFEDAHYWLMEAFYHMANRIEATLDGIAAMASTGSVGSATADFDTGRAEREAYQDAMTQHWDNMPAD